MRRLRKLTTLICIIALVMGAGAALGGDDTKVNINEADAEEIATLKRIGPSIAARIVEYREKKGPFRAPEDIEKMFDDYYEERGWDLKQGVPTQEKIFEMGLAVLYKSRS